MTTECSFNRQEDMENGQQQIEPSKSTHHKKECRISM